MLRRGGVLLLSVCLFIAIVVSLLSILIPDITDTGTWGDLIELKYCIIYTKPIHNPHTDTTNIQQVKHEPTSAFGDNVTLRKLLIERYNEAYGNQSKLMYTMENDTEFNDDDTSYEQESNLAKWEILKHLAGSTRRREKVYLHVDKERREIVAFMIHAPKGQRNLEIQIYEHCLMCVPWVRFLMQTEDTFDMEHRWKKAQSLELPTGGNWMKHHVDLDSGAACFARSPGTDSLASISSNVLLLARDDSSQLWETHEIAMDRSYGTSISALHCRKNGTSILTTISFADDQYVFHRISTDLLSGMNSFKSGPLYNLTNSSAMEVHTVNVAFAPFQGQHITFATEQRSDWERSSYQFVAYNSSNDVLLRAGPSNADFTTTLSRISKIFPGQSTVVTVASTSLLTLDHAKSSWPIYKAPLKSILEHGLFLDDSDQFVLIDDLNSFVFVHKGEGNTWTLAKRHSLPVPVSSLDILAVASTKGSTIFSASEFSNKSFLIVMLEGGILTFFDATPLYKESTTDMTGLLTWDMSDSIASLMCICLFLVWCVYRDPAANQQQQPQQPRLPLLASLIRRSILAMRYVRHQADHLEMYLLRELNNWRQPPSQNPVHMTRRQPRGAPAQFNPTPEAELAHSPAAPVVRN